MRHIFTSCALSLAGEMVYKMGLSIFREKVWSNAVGLGRERGVVLWRGCVGIVSVSSD